MSINLSDRNTTLVYEIDMDSSEKRLSGLTAFRDSGSTINRTLLKDRAAAWYMPTFFAPLLLVSHFLFFAQLLNSQHTESRSTSPHLITTSRRLADCPTADNL